MNDEDGPSGAPGEAALPRGRLIRPRGAVAMAAALALTYLAGQLLGPVPYPPARLQGLIVRLVPGGFATASIEALGHWAMWGLAFAVHAGAIGVGAATAGMIERAPTASRRARRALWVATAAFATASALGLAQGGASLFAPVVYAGAALVFAKLSTSTPLAALLDTELRESETPLDSVRRSRRRLLGRIVAGLAALAGLGGAVALLSRGRRGPQRISPAAQPFVPPPDDEAFPAVRGLSSEITSVSDFYVVDVNFVKPAVDAGRWRLRVGGVVDRPYALTYEELQSGFEVVEMAHTLTCISNEVGGHLISTAVWRGVRLRDVLDRAGLRESAVDVVFRAADSYADSIPVGKALEETTLVVFGMNGVPLPREHGFPARIIVPGIFGMKNVKWLTEIQAADRDVQGYWQRRGWSDTAAVKTQSRIDVPRVGAALRSPATAAGVAWAGDRRISAVEVSDDGGRSWHAATLKRELSPVAWRLWAAQVTGRGDTRLLVRATDGSGALQEARRTRPHPDGASGRHDVSFELE